LPDRTDGAPPRHPAGEPDARFPLANERTLLAYQRTAIGLIAAAVAFGHLLRGGVEALLLCLSLLLGAAVAGVGGFLRYRATDRAMRTGAPLPDTRAPALLALVVALSLVFATVFVVAVR
jgi:putative membrane protein